jgi:hypothetical protein
MNNNPYEDLEYLAEFLPEEGESVIVTRRRGQLVCETFFESMPQTASQTGLVDRELYGRLATLDAKMRVLWQTPVVMTVLATYWACVTLHRGLGLGWNGWYLDVGLMLIAGVACLRFIQRRQRRYFLTQVCPALQKWMIDYQIDKYSLIAWLTTHRNLVTLRHALTRWT